MTASAASLAAAPWRRLPLPLLLAGGLAVVCLAPGCINDVSPGGLPPMCQDSSDCDQAHGEVCDEGVCWGDPPAGLTFAAVLVPPEDRPDLPVTTVPALAIAADGSIGGLSFSRAVAIHGRVLLACSSLVTAPLDCGDTASVGAQITIERAPSFTGGPPLSRTVVAAAGVPPGQDAFTFLLPKDSSAAYRITIVPDDGDGMSPGPGQIAPPRQLTIMADQNQQVDWTVGDPAELKTIAGCVEDVVGNGAPYAGMLVTALGQWTELSPQVRASSRSVTDAAGCFSVQVPIGMLDNFDVLVKPAPGAILPTLRLFDEYVRDPAQGETLVYQIDPPLQMPSAPTPTSFGLPVEAPDSAGGQARVAGADVRFSTTFDVPPPPTAPDRVVQVTFTTQAVTGGANSADPGVAVAQLYGGTQSNRAYQVQVVPPADSQYASAFGLDISVGTGGAGQVALLAPVVLDRRAAVTGEVLTHDGQPVADAPIEARASTVLQLLTQNTEQGALLNQLPFPKSTTDEKGSFLVWLDHELVGRTASYDFDVSPPVASGGPSWSFENRVLSSTDDSIDLGKLILPEASYARGTVHDPGGHPVAGAELHLYQLPSNDICTQSAELSSTCDPPAYLRGIWQTDDEGVVRLVLPDP